jgi:poly(hydroxyalkanoate) depolymerase family esterase
MRLFRMLRLVRVAVPAVLLAACAARGGSVHEAAAGAGTTTRMAHTLLSGFDDGLDYRVYVPAPPAGRRPPLLVMLHGCTQDAAAFSAATHVLRHATGVVVLFPEQTPRANPQRCWNWFDPASQRRDGGEAAMIAALTRRIAASHEVDERRIYVAGISAGGVMAAIMAAAYPDLYAALGVHSGAAFPTASSPAAALAVMRGAADADASTAAAVAAMGPRLRSMPAILVHGTDDAVVAVANADQAARMWWSVHARATGSAAPHVERRAGSDRGRAFEVQSFSASAGQPPVIELWRIAGLGHAWSGGIAGGSYADPDGPDAAALILDFLLQQRRP